MTDRELIAELERVNAALERDRDSAREASRFGSQGDGLPNALASPYRAHGGQPLPVYPSSAFTARIAELEREVAVTEHRRDRAVEQKEDAERVAEDARNDRDDARDRLEVAEAQVATLTRERDEARAARDRFREVERERNRFWGALHRIGYESIGDAEASTDEVLDIITARARAALAPQAEKEDEK